MEFALVLPLFLLLILAIVQVALVMQRQVMLINAAREAAREASVNKNDDAVTQVAHQRTGGSSHVVVHIDRSPAQEGNVRVTLRYRDNTDLPMIGPMLPSIDLDASVTMRQE